MGIGLGVYYGIHAKTISDELTSSSRFDAARDSDRKQAITLQYVGYGVGGAALVGGLAAYYLLGTGNSNVALAPHLAPAYAGLALRLRIQ